MILHELESIVGKRNVITAEADLAPTLLISSGCRACLSIAEAYHRCRMWSYYQEQ
jgi:hypothetical protein